MCIHPACDGLQSNGCTPLRQYTYRPTCNNTDHRMWDYHRPGWGTKGFSVSVRWTDGHGDYSTVIIRKDRQFYCYTQTETWVGRSVWKQCTNVFRMSSTNSSFTTKLCACVSMAFLAIGRLLLCGQYTVHLLVMLSDEGTKLVLNPLTNYTK